MVRKSLLILYIRATGGSQWLKHLSSDSLWRYLLGFVFLFGQMLRHSALPVVVGVSWYRFQWRVTFKVKVFGRPRSGSFGMPFHRGTGSKRFAP
jgi:hypothetical protein